MNFSEWRFPISLIASLWLAIGFGFFIKNTEPNIADLRIQKTLSKPNLQKQLGYGGTLSILGGFSSLLGDFLWLKVYQDWRECQIVSTEFWVKTALQLQPDSLAAWQNAIQIIGRDIPVWRIDEIGWFPKVAKGVRNQIMTEQAFKALDLIESALEFFPNSYELYLDRAHFYNLKIQDNQKSIQAYRDAWNTGEAPPEVYIIYVQKLIENGKKIQARKFLETVLEHYQKKGNQEQISYIDQYLKNWL